MQLRLIRTVRPPRIEQKRVRVPITKRYERLVVKELNDLIVEAAEHGGQLVPLSQFQAEPKLFQRDR